MDRQIVLFPKLRLSTLALPLYQAVACIGLWLWDYGKPLSFTTATVAVLVVGLPIYVDSVVR